MMRVLSRRRRGVLLTFAAFLTALQGSATGAQIWERPVPFQACLEGRFDAWLNARVELIVNEAPKAGDIDDVSVAKWAAETLAACRAQAGGGDEASEARFTKHVAQWHKHIYDRVQTIRERVRPD
jgi:hypothetical protein